LINEHGEFPTRIRFAAPGGDVLLHQCGIEHGDLILKRLQTDCRPVEEIAWLCLAHS